MLPVVFLFYHLVYVVSSLLQLLKPSYHVEKVEVCASLRALVLICLAIVLLMLIPFVHLMDVPVHFHIFFSPVLMVNISKVAAVVAICVTPVAGLLRD